MKQICITTCYNIFSRSALLTGIVLLTLLVSGITSTQTVSAQTPAQTDPAQTDPAQTNPAYTNPEQTTAELAAVLASPDSSLYARTYACKLSARTGAESDIAVLAKYLDDEQLSHPVRLALLQFSSKEADTALCASLKTVTDPLRKAGIARTLGQRNAGQNNAGQNNAGQADDSDAVADLVVSALAPLLAESASVEGGISPVFQGAAWALGQIQSRAAIATLQDAWNQASADTGRSALLNELAPALFVCASKYMLDDAELAKSVYQPVFDSKTVSPRFRAIACQRLIELSEPQQQSVLFGEAFVSTDQYMFQAALQTMKHMDQDQLWTRIAKDFPTYDTTKKMLMLELIRSKVLQSRQDKIEYTFPTELVDVVITTACQPCELDLRNRAVRTSGILANASHAQQLFESADKAQKGDWSVVVSFLDAMQEIQDPKFNEIVLDMLNKNEGPHRSFMTQLAAGLHMVEAREHYLRDLVAESKWDRRAAGNGCVNTMTEEDIPVLVSLVLAPENRAQEVSDSVLSTIQRMIAASNRKSDVAATLIGILGTVDKSQCTDEQRSRDRLFVYNALAATGTGEALKVFDQLLQSGDESVEDLVLQSLGTWPTEAAAPLLLKAARTAVSDKLKDRAIRGYIRVFRQMRLGDSTKIVMARNIEPEIRRIEERNLWIEALARINSPEAARMVKPWLKDPQTAEAAENTYITLVPVVGLANPEVQQILTEIAKSGKTEEIKRAAEDLLKGSAVQRR